MTQNMLTGNKKSMKIPKDVIRIRKSKKGQILQLPKGQGQRQNDKQRSTKYFTEN